MRTLCAIQAGFVLRMRCERHLPVQEFHQTWLGSNTGKLELSGALPSASQLGARSERIITQSISSRHGKCPELFGTKALSEKPQRSYSVIASRKSTEVV